MQAMWKMRQRWLSPLSMKSVHWSTLRSLTILNKPSGSFQFTYFHPNLNWNTLRSIESTDSMDIGTQHMCLACSKKCPLHLSEIELVEVPIISVRNEKVSQPTSRPRVLGSLGLFQLGRSWWHQSGQQTAEMFLQLRHPTAECRGTSLCAVHFLLMLGKDLPHMDLQVTVTDIAVSPSPTARYLDVVLDNQLCCTANINAVAVALYNIRRIRPFLTREAAQLLVQALLISRLNYCNSLLAGLPASTIKLLQHIQNATAHLVFILPKLT